MTLQGLVNKSYPSPEWAVFFEVADSTGFQGKRRADAVALGIWPSRGQTLVGFEFKEDRRDWLRERENPAKAEVIAAHCDGWFVVAGRDGIVKLEELPEPWGLYVANEDRTKLLSKKPCQWFIGRDKTTIQRSFAAAMLRKVSETTVPKVELERLVEEAVKAAVDRTQQGYELKTLREDVVRLQGIVDHFKAATGVNLAGWQGTEKISKAVDAVLHLDTERRNIESSAKQLEMAARTMRDVLAAWPISSVGTNP